MSAYRVYGTDDVSIHDVRWGVALHALDTKTNNKGLVCDVFGFLK